MIDGLATALLRHLQPASSRQRALSCKYRHTVGTERLAAAREALARGDVLIAYDEARAAVAVDPDDLDAQYIAVLALARSGAAPRALDAAEVLQARIDAADGASRRLLEDVAALSARISKTQALNTGGAQRTELLIQAADRYAAIAEAYGGSYPAINAATLTLLAGDPMDAARRARRALELIATQPAHEQAEGYWTAATQAEAALILGDTDAAKLAIDRAARLSTADVGARATTRRQLALVCGATETDAAILAPLALPDVLHYCGHIIGDDSPTARFPVAFVEQVGDDIAAYLDARQVGFAFGSLASGADILIAEAVLSRGGELHVVLPFDVEEFEAVSVRPAGEHWIRRFRSCLDAASSIRYACDSAYLGDDSLFAHASQIAMGHARLRADVLGIEAEQLAIWDHQPARGVGGTADDVQLWNRIGGTTHVIPLPPNANRDDDTALAPTNRSVHALLFADFHGFSTLRDEHYEPVLAHVYQPLAEVLDRHVDAILWRNVWGDALSVVFTDVAAAGSCALELQEANEQVDRRPLGLPTELGLRISVHVGPVLAQRDPFRSQLGWWGREMTRAAHIEPRTPEGHVYATDAFAALLALRPDAGIDSDYVGRITTAKNFETIPMYRLRRIT